MSFKKNYRFVISSEARNLYAQDPSLNRDDSALLFRTTDFWFRLCRVRKVVGNYGN
uniref:Uncharacterized protein n=1 Tax=Candidatus Kentrum sp. DK TaxID=2126562 RepID=A0A450RVH5_9GAMM|nr:MAG: hypothetical protein BECKDK2373C_GA0170839_100431 [Candidatus Kentron sp. DK]